jgi:PAS domain S-box-containing protein
MINPVQPLSNQQLLDVLSLYHNGIAVHIGPEFVIQYASDAMIAIWGKNRSVIGKALEDALPELKGQPFIDMFKKVWDEGITISGTDTPADLLVDGVLQTFYFDFEYKAVLDEHGNTYCILHTATDITKRFLAQQREQSMAEEVRAINEELSASNEEMMATNEELMESQQKQNELYEELAESNARFRSMVKQAPVGICMIRAEDLLIEEANDTYLELVGKTVAEMTNRTIWQAIPEAAEALTPVMNEVINTGIPFFATEYEIVLIRAGIPEVVYVDFVYEPIGYTEGGKANTIMVLAIDVTEKVTARRSIEEVEERIRLAVEAGDIGTFDLDLATGVMLTSERFNVIFGFDKTVEWKVFAAAIHPDDYEVRVNAHNKSLETGVLFYEARVIYPDQSIHWVRVQGKVLYDGQKEPYRILGTFLDITQVQRLNQQKDDFISIASHELKTPITSLKASLQLLDRMKNNPAPELLPRLIEQSNRSMQKISSLVEDLLNVSRANETGLKLNKTHFAVSELLNDCCNHVRVGGKYQLIVQGDEQIQMYADAHSIDQVVVNLVNNAVKYAPDSLEIIMTIEKLDGAVKVSVKDTGPGIHPDKIAHLFDRYYQAENSGFQNSGLGLGLYISSEIVKRHGGSIGVDSRLGKGSTFWFTVPNAL